jgi:hypothetical protein
MKQLKWQIKFKVVDRKARQKGTKAILTNIDVIIPTELIGGVLYSIGQEALSIERTLKDQALVST